MPAKSTEPMPTIQEGLADFDLTVGSSHEPYRQLEEDEDTPSKPAGPLAKPFKPPPPGLNLESGPEGPEPQQYGWSTFGPTVQPPPPQGPPPKPEKTVIIAPPKPVPVAAPPQPQQLPESVPPPPLPPPATSAVVDQLTQEQDQMLALLEASSDSESERRMRKPPTHGYEKDRCRSLLRPFMKADQNTINAYIGAPAIKEDIMISLQPLRVENVFLYVEDVFCRALLTKPSKGL